MGFSEFQTVEATMKKITTDGAGDKTVDTSFTVDIDPVLGYERMFSDDGEEIEGQTTVISPHDSIDVSHRNWELTYDSNDYQVERLEPFYHIGTTTISHYEAVLR